MRLALLVLITFHPAFAHTAPSFEPNRGQFSPEVTFVSRASPISVAIVRDGLLFDRGADRLHIRFADAAPLRCAPASPAVGTANYLASQPAIPAVPTFAAISCANLYPGIDWTLHDSAGLLEHDWILAPHADPSAIDLRIEGARAIRITSAGEVRIESAAFTIAWKTPVAYQEIEGRRRFVPVSYVLAGSRLALKAGAYDRSRPLIIDPVLDFVYVLGGNGDDRGFATGVDGAGNVYVAGLTTSTDFQATKGAAVTSPIPNSAEPQVFVRKLSSDGSKLIYSTYLGASGLSSHSIGMRVDVAGNVYLASDAFTDPLPAGGTPIDPFGAVTVFKLAPAGDRLIYATRVIPNLSYSLPVALAIDAVGDAYVAAGSTTISVSKIDPSGQKQVYRYTSTVSNYFGGVGGIAVGSDGRAYIVGTTASGGLVTTPGAWRTTIGNPQDGHGYLICLKPDGSAPIFSTYIGGDLVDNAYDVAVDSAGNAIVAGATYRGSGFAGLSGTPLGLSAVSDNNGFIVKLKADGSGPIWSALLPCPKLSAVALDPAGNVYAAGPTVSGAVVLKLNPAGTSLLYYSNIPADPNTPLTSDARTVGMSVDSAGAAYLAGSSVTLSVPEMRPIAGVQPNAWFAKVDANPPQADLALSVSSDTATVVPGQVVTYTVTVANNGQAQAEDIVISAAVTGAILACGASSQGQCSGGRITFSSIAAGQTQTLTLLTSIGSGRSGDKIVAQVSASTLSSDVNQDNNSASTSMTFNYASLSVSSNLQCSFRYNSSSQLLASGNFLNVAPNSIVAIEWPSPQICLGTTAVFQRWLDGSTDNPRTFAIGTDSVNALAIFGTLKTPLVSSGGVTNAGSYANDGVSPGEIVTIFGFNLGGQLASGQLAGGQLGTQIATTRVLFDGIAAPLVYAGSTTVSAIVPYDVAGKSSTNMVVQANNASSPPMQLPVLDALPALLTTNASGTGQAAALNQDASVNSPSNPAHAGDVIVLFGTGEGLVAPIPANGAIVGSPAPLPVLPVTVTIGGRSARVLYAGGVPGEPAGVFQINAEIPPGLPANHHTLAMWSAGPKSSQQGVTIAIE